MRARSLLVCLVALLQTTATAGEDEVTIPGPRFDRVQHDTPEDYLTLPDTLGDADSIRAVAATLARDTPRETLAAIGLWVERTFRHDAEAAYAWRDMDRMRAEGTYGGCADHSVIVGSLARACGIPTVWVKTMDIDWIREFRRGVHPNWRGHVFLEVYLDERWRLLDATQSILYEQYQTTSRVLPGGRFAYDKGGDPYALILSCRWEVWLEQTDAFFRQLDLETLPWGQPSSLTKRWEVHVVGDSPSYQWVLTKSRALGYRSGSSFNGEFARRLPNARGATLVIMCTRGEPVLAEPFREAYLPADWQAALEADGRVERRLNDGTRVILLAATSEAETAAALDELLPSLEPASQAAQGRE